MLIWHPCSPHTQDAIYGPNIRVCNRTEKEGVYRCTVCDKEVTKGSGAATAKAEAKKAGKS